MATLGELGLSSAAGALTTLSPCVFPLLPLVLGAAVQRNRFAPLAMGVGMVVTFTAIGVLFGVAGTALGFDPDGVRTVGAVLLLVLGVVMLVPAFAERFTALFSGVASAANQAAGHFDTASLGGAMITGALLGLIWSPCSGPLLASALTLVASEGGAVRGAVILGAFGTGAAIPLVAVGYASRAGIGKARGWVLRHAGAVRAGFGVLLVAIGLMTLLGWDKWLEGRILDLLPEGWVALTTRI